MFENICFRLVRIHQVPKRPGRFCKARVTVLGGLLKWCIRRVTFATKKGKIFKQITKQTASPTERDIQSTKMHTSTLIAVALGALGIQGQEMLRFSCSQLLIDRVDP